MNGDSTHGVRQSDEREDRRDAAGRSLVASALQECGLTLDAQVAREAPADELRKTVDIFIQAARHTRMPPERTLALFKAMVLRLKAVERHHVVNRGEMVRVLAQMAIDAYYDGQPRRKGQ